MILQEPKVEFMAINFSDSIATTSSGTGGGQRCVASQEDSHECSNFEELIPWSQSDN